tara:strand:+ start:207 stop:350 length:144 start_codon:yes stop_codon:yes gene_type:complete
MNEIRIPVSKPTPQTIAGTNHIVYPPWWIKENKERGLPELTDNPLIA